MRPWKLFHIHIGRRPHNEKVCDPLKKESIKIKTVCYHHDTAQKITCTEKKAYTEKEVIMLQKEQQGILITLKFSYELGLQSQGF